MGVRVFIGLHPLCLSRGPGRLTWPNYPFSPVPFFFPFFLFWFLFFFCCEWTFHPLRDWAHVGVVLCELPTAPSRFGSTGVLWVSKGTTRVALHPGWRSPERQLFVDCGVGVLLSSGLVESSTPFSPFILFFFFLFSFFSCFSLFFSFFFLSFCFPFFSFSLFVPFSFFYFSFFPCFLFYVFLCLVFSLFFCQIQNNFWFLRRSMSHC